MTGDEADHRQQLDRIIGKPARPTEGLSDAAAKEDFAQFGFSPDRIKEIFKKKGREIDSCTQILNGTAAQRKHEQALEKERFIDRETRSRQRRNREKNSPEGRKMVRGYEPLPIEGTESKITTR